jgi:hypothetical protein
MLFEEASALRFAGCRGGSGRSCGLVVLLMALAVQYAAWDAYLVTIFEGSL